jgi:hypothetical protein
MPIQRINPLTARHRSNLLQLPVAETTRGMMNARLHLSEPIYCPNKEGHLILACHDRQKMIDWDFLAMPVGVAAVSM